MIFDAGFVAFLVVISFLVGLLVGVGMVWRLDG